MYGHSYFRSRREVSLPWGFTALTEGPGMARIGTVIREVYHRPGAGALPAHLADRYGIRVTGTARLTEGVFRVDRDAGPPWVARIMLTGRPESRTEEDAEILRFL